jgi:ribosomal protein S18 acetylase RimI-like enzyme
MIDVRPAAPADHAALRPLFDELDRLHRQNAPWMFQTPESDPRPPSHHAALLADPHQALFVAEDAELAPAERCVGLAHVLLRNTPPFGVFIPRCYAVVDSIVVLPSARRRGIGRLLHEACNTWSAAQRAAWIELTVYDFNVGARAFYAALGYQVMTQRLRRPLP